MEGGRRGLVEGGRRGLVEGVEGLSLRLDDGCKRRLNQCLMDRRALVWEMRLTHQNMEARVGLQFTSSFMGME